MVAKYRVTVRKIQMCRRYEWDANGAGLNWSFVGFWTWRRLAFYVPKVELWIVLPEEIGGFSMTNGNVLFVTFLNNILKPIISLFRTQTNRSC